MYLVSTKSSVLPAAALGALLALSGCASDHGAESADDSAAEKPADERDREAAPSTRTAALAPPAPGPCRETFDKDADGEPEKVIEIRWDEGRIAGRVIDDKTTDASPDKIVRFIWQNGRKVRKLVDSHGKPKYRVPEPDGIPDVMVDWRYEDGQLSRRLEFRKGTHYRSSDKFGEPRSVTTWERDARGRPARKVQKIYRLRDRRLKAKHVWTYKEGRKVEKKTDHRGGGRMQARPDGKFDRRTKWKWRDGHISRERTRGPRTTVALFDWEGGRKTRKRLWHGYTPNGKPHAVWTWTYDERGRKLRVERDGQLYSARRKDGKVDAVRTFEYRCDE